MALIRWEPVAELNTIQNEMNRLFNTFFDQPAANRPRQRYEADDGCPRWTWSRGGDHYVLRADLPGLSDEDVNIQLQDNVLTISGERNTAHEEQRGGYYRLERAFGSFARSLTLPDGVNPDGVQAHFDRGVLEIRIPKPERKKPRQVPDQPRQSSRATRTRSTALAPRPQSANGREPAAMAG